MQTFVEAILTLLLVRAMFRAILWAGRLASGRRGKAVAA